MKILYPIMALFGLLTFAAFGQDSQSEYQKLKPQLTEAKAERADSRAVIGHRMTVWSEDFSGGFDGPNGEWTTSGPDPDIWQYTDSVIPGCWSGSGNDATPFTTKDNGFMLYHPDAVNCNDNTIDPPIFDDDVYEGSLVSPTIDLTDVPAVLVSFENRFRYCCSSDFALWFSVSTDDGMNWVDFDVTTGTPVNDYNSDIVTRINVSQFVANEPNVKFKFTWNATGTASHYLWAIDDIEVEIPPTNDMKLVDLAYQEYEAELGDDFTDIKYTIYQVDQVRPLNLIGYAVNNGSLEQSNVVMNAQVTTPSDVLNLSSSPQTVAVGDTGIFEISYTPANEVGVYQLLYEIVTESTDSVPGDNSDSLSFSIDDIQFARDERDRDGAFTNYEGDFKTGLGYTFTEDATIYGIAVGLDTSSVVGAFFNGQIVEPYPGFSPLAETDFLAVDESMMNSGAEENFAELILLQPFEVEAGESIMPAFVFEGGDDAINVALSGDCPDYACWVWTYIATEDQECDPCYYNSIPMIRPLIGENVSLQEVEAQDGVTLGQNVPNPADAYTIITFKFDNSARDVQFEIHDLNGRQVLSKPLGNLPSGEHTEIINTASYENGVYLYSLMVNGKRQTKRMVVLRK